MNASLNIIDNNLPLVKEAELFSPLSASESSKGNGLSGNGFQAMVVSNVFEPGSFFDLVEIDLSKTNINSTLNQSLPSNLVSIQSMLDNNNSNCLGSTPGDVGNNGEAGDLLCLVSGPLVAVPSVVLANSTSWPSSFCGVEYLPAKPC
ncbi:hypothetical protein DSO57_1031999 [Entomophthora muscae]|uniref:Uncharacterized protein n=1 Tax=Entomophthora muscae TaxID=34485 RepID=A0ACC2RRQ4_9FUNG|nr:hypothetical protein DSO57_1031999 [Entomophthora muscae]